MESRNKTESSIDEMSIFIEKITSLSSEKFNQLNFHENSLFAKIVTLPKKWLEKCLEKFAQYPEKEFKDLCLCKLPNQSRSCGAYLLARLIYYVRHNDVSWHTTNEAGFGYPKMIHRLIAISPVWEEALHYKIKDPSISKLDPEPTKNFIPALTNHFLIAKNIEQPIILSSYQLPIDILKYVANALTNTHHWYNKTITWLHQLKTLECQHKDRMLPLTFEEINSEINTLMIKMKLPTEEHTYLRNFMYFALSEYVAKVADTSAPSLKLRFSLLKKIENDGSLRDSWVTKSYNELASHYFNRGSNYGLFGRTKDLRKAISYAIKACLLEFTHQNKLLLKEIVNSYLRTNINNMYYIPKTENNTDVIDWLEKKLTKILNETWTETKISEIITALTNYRVDIQLEVANVSKK